MPEILIIIQTWCNLIINTRNFLVINSGIPFELTDSECGVHVMLKTYPIAFAVSYAVGCVVDDV